MTITIDKIYRSFDDAVSNIYDGATIMIGGFGGPGGYSQNLIKSLNRKGVKDLTIIGCAPAISEAIGDIRFG